MPKYNLNVELTNLEGQKLIIMSDPAIDEETGELVLGEDGKPLPQKRIPLTAANAVIKALTNDNQQNLNDDADKKAIKYRIAKRVKQAVINNEDVALTAQDIDVIKDAIGKLWGIMTVGGIDSILEG